MIKVKSNVRIQIISRAVAILRVLSDKGMSLGAIATATGLPRSTVQRLVDALAAEDMVETGNSGARLSWGLAQIAERGRVSIVSRARPALETLFARTHETVDISTLQGHEVSFLDRIVSDKELRVVPFPDKPRPLHAMANGKALLATFTNDYIAHILSKGLVGLTSSTITDLPRLLDELESVRETGFSFDREEHAPGVCAIGTSVILPGHRPYAFSVVMPASRFSELEDVCKAALKESKALLEATE